MLVAVLLTVSVFVAFVKDPRKIHLFFTKDKNITRGPMFENCREIGFSQLSPLPPFGKKFKHYCQSEQDDSI